jgi:predicted ArsR family transcriptional regulator
LQQFPQVEGIIPTDILGLPEPFDVLLRTLMRQGSMTVDQLAAQLDLPPHQAQQLGDGLVTKGYLRVEEPESEEESGQGRIYRVYYARMRKHNIPSDLLG